MSNMIVYAIQHYPLGHQGRSVTTGPDLGLSDVFAEKRQAEAARIRDKYPDRIPVSLMHTVSCLCWPTCADVGLLSMQVIVEKAEKSDIPDIDKKK
jgi:hypothetical protein